MATFHKTAYDYIHPERYPHGWQRVFNRIREEIERALYDVPTFVGMDFCDVYAGGVQLRGHHKDVPGYSYGAQITLLYDLSNADDAIAQFIAAWKAKDTPADVGAYQSFLEEGQKWGWD